MQDNNCTLEHRVRTHIEYIYQDVDAVQDYAELTRKVLASAQLEILLGDQDIPAVLWSQEDVAVISYGDTIVHADQVPLVSLKDFLDRHMQGVINTVHLLPFFPFSSDDGFAVQDYRCVNPILGDWEHINNIANVNNYDKYREYLINRIKIVWQSEKRFNLLTDKYNNDIEYGFTELERNKAQTLKEAVRPKLNQSRETLVYYKRLWAFVKNKSANSANAKSLMLEAQTNFESILNTPVTNNERNEYGGWENGKGNFPNIDLAGLENYQADTGNLY